MLSRLLKVSNFHLWFQIEWFNKTIDNFLTEKKTKFNIELTVKLRDRLNKKVIEVIKTDKNNNI